MHFIDCLAGLPELEKVIVMPFIRKAEEIDLSDIPNRYKVFTDMFDSRFVFCGVKLDFFFAVSCYKSSKCLQMKGQFLNLHRFLSTILCS